MTKRSKTLYLNEKQLQFLQAMQPVKIALAGRGWGKSSLIGFGQRQKMSALPRAKFFFASTTYNQILTKTLPAAENIWQEMGMVEDVHYSVGKKPPKHFALPYAPPRKWQNVISIYNGFCIEMLSMDRPDLARGGSYDGGEVDEMALIKQEVVTKVLLPSIRGNSHRFSSPLHQQFCGYTSVPWKPSGYWVLDYEEKQKQDPDEYFLIEGTAYDNIEILGQKYIDRLEREMSYLEFQVEVMNRRFMKVPDGFYHAFDDKKHTYSPEYEYGEGVRGITVVGTKDVNSEALLEVSFDFSGWFNCCTIWQEQGNTERCVANLYVKEDQKLNELIKKFCQRYKEHKVKFVRVWGEPRGHDPLPMTPSIYETIKALFESEGWGCEIAVKAGRTNNHLERHQFMADILLERNPTLPKVSINEESCKELIIAIQVTEITQDMKKNKSKEKDRNFPQEHAPHLTDTMDYYLIQKHGWKFFNDVNYRAGEAIFL